MVNMVLKTTQKAEHQQERQSASPYMKHKINVLCLNAQCSPIGNKSVLLVVDEGVVYELVVRSEYAATGVRKLSLPQVHHVLFSILLKTLPWFSGLVLGRK